MSDDQENAAPPIDPVANVCNAAHDAMAALIDRSARGSIPKRRRQRNSDTEKVESLYSSFDGLEVVLSLAEDVKQYLVSLTKNSNYSISPGSIGPATDALDFMSSAEKKCLSDMRAKSNSTAAKSQAA